MVSIIIPIYNSEKYLFRCIKSLLDQTYTNLEIILINDGSTDNSKKICEDFANKDSRIRIINNKNEGVSIARNYGLASAKGDFISFVDSDDYVEPDYIKKMLLKLEEEKADIVYCSAIIEDDKGKQLRNEYLKDELIDVNKYDWNSPTAHCVVRGALFSKSIINNYKFDKNLYVGEDTYFFAQCLKRARYVYCMKDGLYHYVIYNESLSHGNSIQKLVTEICAWEKIVYLFNNNSAKVACAMRCQRFLFQYRNNNLFKKTYHKRIKGIYKNYFVIMMKYHLKKKKIDEIVKDFISLILL